MQVLIIQQLCALWLCMCCLVAQIKELNKVLLPPLLAEDNSNPSDIHRQLDSSWGFIRNPTYGQKQHTPRCFREPQAARTDGRNHHPQTVIRGTSGHMLDFFSMKRIEGRHSIHVAAAAASWGSGRQRSGGRLSQVINRSRCDISSPEISPLPGGWNKSKGEVPRNSDTVQCLQITAHNLLGNSTAHGDTLLSDFPLSSSCFH